MKLALIVGGVVQGEASPEDAELVGHDDKPLFDIRDVSGVSGIVPGWLVGKKGGFEAPPPPPVVVPSSVSSAQAKIQLRRMNLRDKADAFVHVTGGEIVDWFTDSRTWDRSSPYVEDLRVGLKATPDQFDQLFVEASQISA